MNVDVDRDGANLNAHIQLCRRWLRPHADTDYLNVMISVSPFPREFGYDAHTEDIVEIALKGEQRERVLKLIRTYLRQQEQAARYRVAFLNWGDE